ncbi:DUF1858 domain-containing protein [Anaerolinea thermophila]|uniref:DUF1858 domain-containing protein n=1 Tax=Anaerolinea thermophila (strain DSM 14523 / JCM 11388 / NBRC 100420 / UNI-1) TaxID=926569 RepID=E8N0W2_ANATU|nr:DUF1858 domain-containing protein [Anaerolinea thermophila]BAJ62507.1 hypothetical protein ANT_04730 [Anaerolinea thermophila UNI-1]
MNITPQTRIGELLREYPALEEDLIRIAPAFKNLRNPVLRRTIGQLATLEKVAQIGNVTVLELVNTLRRAVGQPEMATLHDVPRNLKVSRLEEDPDWIQGEPQLVINGTELLQRGEVPLVQVNAVLPSLENGRYLLLISDFEPAPLLDALQKQGCRVHHRVNPEDTRQHWTFISRL